MPQVLDAPSLQDDFYLNLVDWSSQNVLAVGLGTCIYLWSACTSKARSRTPLPLHIHRHPCLHGSAHARVMATSPKRAICFATSTSLAVAQVIF